MLLKVQHVVKVPANKKMPDQSIIIKEQWYDTSAFCLQRNFSAVIITECQCMIYHTISSCQAVVIIQGQCMVP